MARVHWISDSFARHLTRRILQLSTHELCIHTLLAEQVIVRPFLGHLPAAHFALINDIIMQDGGGMDKFNTGRKTDMVTTLIPQKLCTDNC